jgi:hypothetical protein
MEDELFRLTINEEGREEINRFYRRAKVAFALSVLFSCLELITSWWRIVYFERISRGFVWSAPMIATWVYTAVFMIMTPIQAYYYLLFGKWLRTSLRDSDEIRLNRSFRILNINAALCIVTLVIGISYILYSLLDSFNRGR